MGRKTEQEIVLDGQIRFWEGKLRKSRTTSQQLDIAKVLERLRAERWPNPLDEAAAVAKAAKLQLKAEKAAAVRAKEADAAELERLTAIERQKVRDEASPVIDHVKRAQIRAELREEKHDGVQVLPQALIEDHPKLEALVVENALISDTQSDVQPSDGAVVSPEITTITREAEASAKQQSSTRKGDGLAALFKLATTPLEPRDGVAISTRQYVPAILTESSGPGETSARLAASEHAREVLALSPENQGMELVTDWAGNQEWRRRGQE